MTTRVILVECAIVMGIFSLSSGLGMTYVAHWGQDAKFYQREYGPAVMVAAGRGFVNPVVTSVPGLEDFLAVKSESFDMTRVPADIAIQPLTQLQARWRYLLCVTGLTWRVFGVSWTALLPIYGLLIGLTSISTYALFRAGCGRVVSIAGALLCLLSPFNLYYLPALRDYSKVPFIIATIAILAHLNSL